MSDQFRSRIRQSLADENLQSALDANAERRIRVRKEALSSLVNAEDLRRRAHLVRMEVIEHLEDYLEQFTFQADKNGLQVHHAADSGQAIKIITEIALKHGAKLIAKSKTMVSEEIGLNHELEKLGLRVVETDLGEYIVQLRGETPSHIITPAVHLRKQDVGRLFEEKLGLPYTEDISLMTNLARRILRQVFFDADIGISGVNFGVAETGTLCVVTNEGNGRMVTTLPNIHIALMGIERIVPTLDDLALMLSLLPRSATGQKISVYTNLLNSPRQADDADGPQQRHLILVDNGRNKVRGSKLREALYCIRCGACLNECPVFREIGGHAYVGIHGKISPYPGPIGSLVSAALFSQDEYGHLARASSLCGACREACPVDIDLPKLLLRVRAGMGVNQTERNIKPNAPAALRLGMNLYAFAAESPKRFEFAQKLVGWFGAVARWIKRNDAWIHLPAFSGWGYSKDFPTPAGSSFQSRHLKELFIEENQVEKPEMRREIFTAKPISISNAPSHANDLVKIFSNELEMLGGKFLRCTQAEVSQRILEILKVQGITEILTWEESYLPDGLLQELSRSDIHIIHPSAQTQRDCSHVRAGLTGATAANAETGSLLVPGGPGRPLTASLLPEIHIALLWERDIFGSLSEVLNTESARNAPSSVLVSGPSRTADIEMTLTIGVHGPGELYVICIHDG